MSSLAQQRCFNHSLREAVARCPSCRQHYCRECITEHDDRVICAACLQQLMQPRVRRRPGLDWLRRLIPAGAGLLAAWFFFYFIGATLAKLPTSFYEGTIQQTNWLNPQ